MSCYQSRKVKWSSFLLLFIILFLELPSPVASGRCQKRCAKHREDRYSAVTINCEDDEYDYDEENFVEECKDDCGFCPDLCDASAHIIKCPAIDLARCEKHCDANRPTGSTSAYILDCEKKYTSQAEIDKCKSVCNICLPGICDSDNPTIYHCPSINSAPSINDRCKEHCDSDREDEFPYTLNCKNSVDSTACRQNCEHCTRQICNPYDADIFNCPKGSTVCELRCNKNRPVGSTSAYTHHCTDDPYICKYDCGKCPQICDVAKNPYIFNCPAKGTPIPTAATTTTTPSPTTIPTYAGRCENRCNSKRPKLSQEAYKLKCEEYGTTDEVEECRSDCDHCPEGYCKIIKDYAGNKRVEFDCPFLKITRRCEDFCKAQRRFLRHHQTGSFHITCYNNHHTNAEIEYCKSYCKDCPENVCQISDPVDYDCPAIDASSFEKPEHYTKDPLQVDDKPGSQQLSTLAIVGVVLGLLLLVGVVGGIIFFVIRKKKAKSQVKPVQAPEGVFEFEHNDNKLSPMTSAPSISSISRSDSVSSIDSVSTTDVTASTSRLPSTRKSMKPKKHHHHHKSKK